MTIAQNRDEPAATEMASYDNVEMMNLVSGQTSGTAGATGRLLADFFEPRNSPDTLRFSVAESGLLKCAREGREFKASGIAVSQLEQLAADPPSIRAAFVRFLLLGGDANNPVHERGLDICGARIEGDLDLSGCKETRILRLIDCYLTGALRLDLASTASIYLDGSSVKRIEGDRVEINGSLYMRKNFVAREGVDLSGARVTGSVSCRGGKFKEGESIDQAEASRSYCFRMYDAKIDGTLILGPRHKADENSGGNWTELHGDVSLTGTTCTGLADHPLSYKHVRALDLHGFRYERLVTAHPDFRSSWLKMQHLRGFSPQPYAHLAGILAETGYENTARQILMERQRWEYQDLQQRRRRTLNKWTFSNWRVQTATLFSYLRSVIWNLALRIFIGYGYRPSRSILWSLIPLAVGYFVFGYAYKAGNMVPTNPVVSLRDEWKHCKEIAISPGAYIDDFSFRNGSLDLCLKNKMPDYPRFNAVWYTVDTFVPFLDLYQEDYWTPGTRGWTRSYMNGHIAAGWLLVTLGISGMLGLVQRRSAPGGR